MLYVKHEKKNKIIFSRYFFRSFEALAEISRFVTGLVQRVPKKTNEVKFYLQNSTSS